MKYSPVLITSIILLCNNARVDTEHNAHDDKAKIEQLKQMEEMLNEQINKILKVSDKSKLRSGFESLRKKINEMNDETRLSSFEINNVPNHCIAEEDKDIILELFAAAIDFPYCASDVLEIKYFVKKHPNVGLPKGDFSIKCLNYVVKVKTVALKEKWMEYFKMYAQKFGYKELFSFPGVNMVYEKDGLGERELEYFTKRYSLVNVTMRDHLSPFKMNLMSVVRGKIKPRRHFFRASINRSRLFLDRLLPLNKIVRQEVVDFSDIINLDLL